MFYFHHTDRNSIKSHIVTLNSLEKRMLIHVLDLFDGGGGTAEAPKKTLNPPLNTGTITKIFLINLVHIYFGNFLY